jgi:undecaprenyl-diphosphatase
MPAGSLTQMREPLRRLTEPFILAALAATAAGVFAFIKIASEVLEGETDRIDRWVVDILRDPADASHPIGPAWLERAARDITALGDFVVLTLAVLSVAAFLVLAQRRRLALFVLAAAFSGMLLAALLKDIFERNRPAPAVDAYLATFSFPSGHALISAVVYFTLGALLARLAPQWRLKIYVLGVALGVTVLIGLSRIYLGVHWPSDVAAGWAIGAAWALGWWTAAQLFPGDAEQRS